MIIPKHVLTDLEGSEKYAKLGAVAASAGSSAGKYICWLFLLYHLSR